MSLGCEFLDPSSVTCAIYESCLGHDDQKGIYSRFTDRLDAKKIPYLVIMEGDVYKLEMPLPQAYIFTIEDKTALDE